MKRLHNGIADSIHLSTSNTSVFHPCSGLKWMDLRPLVRIRSQSNSACILTYCVLKTYFNMMSLLKENMHRRMRRSPYWPGNVLAC